MDPIYKILESFSSISNESRMSDIDAQAQEFAQNAIEMAKGIQRDNYYFSDSSYYEFFDGLDEDDEVLVDHPLVQTVLRSLPNVDMDERELKQAVDALANMSMEELSMNEANIDEAEVDENAFNQAAAAAARAGKDSFEFGGKTHNTTMKKDTAHKLDDDVQMEDEDDVEDKGEYDQEGEMAEGQLRTIQDAAAELKEIIDADDNLPEWVQSKITKALDYLDTARDYMGSKEEAEDEEVDIEIDEARDTHCSDKCCGSDVKAADCGCPPDCPHCNCNAKMDETTTAGSVSIAPAAESKSPYGGSVYESAFNEKMNLNEDIQSNTVTTDTVTVTASGADAEALQKLLQMAGMSSGYSEVVPAAPEEIPMPMDAEEVDVEVDEALANAPDEKYQDTAYMQNTVSGGLNGQKKQVNPNNPGDNPRAMQNMGANSVNLDETVKEIEESKVSKLWDLYKEFK